MGYPITLAPNMSWLYYAIRIIDEFDGFIIPVLPTKLPAVKLNPTKYTDLPLNQQPSQDKVIVEAWSRRFKAYGVVPLGKMLLVDVDIKEGVYGKRCLKFLRDNGLPLNTYCVKSPSGGVHLYYHTPTHYTPQQGVSHRVLFESQALQERWDQIPTPSGIDTRFGHGYVVGAGSVTNSGMYTLLDDKPLQHIPSHIFIGKKSTVKVKTLPALPMPDAFTQVSSNRNNDGLAWTMWLRRKSLPDDAVKILIEEKVRHYVGDDAPTAEVLWDQYQRAPYKDVLHDMVMNKVYIIQGKKVMDIVTLSTVDWLDFHNENRNIKIPIEVKTSSGDVKTKMVNPADLWIEDVDRKTVIDIIYDPRLGEGIIDVVGIDGYDDGRYFNCWKQVVHSKVDAPNGELIFNAVKDVIHNVVTDEVDRRWLLKWIGILVINPAFKPAWSIHIFSKVRGVGKDTLADIITVMYGSKNVCYVNSDIFTGSFNKDIFTHGLGVLSDFTPVSSNRSDIANANFKQITGTKVFKRRDMYREGCQAPLFIRFLMLSNDGTDFPVDRGDRRLYKINSEGEKLDSKTSILARCFIDLDRVSKKQLDLHELPDITKDDVLCARWLFYSWLEVSGYEELYSVMDCPTNETKRQFEQISEVGYIGDVRDLIAHGSFIFVSDIQCKASIRCLMTMLGIRTKVETVIYQLVQARLLVPLVIKDTKPRRYKFVKSRPLTYDEDLQLIIEMKGVKSDYMAYSCRNHERWSEGRGYQAEYTKLIGLAIEKDETMLRIVDGL